MRLVRPLRLTAVLLLFLVLAAILVLLLLATESALVVWRYLAEAPAWVAAAWLTLVGLIAGAGLWLAWRLMFGARRRRKRQARRKPPTQTELVERIEKDRALGLDVQAALDELREKRRRQREQAVHVAFFGEISAGKSALIRALAPDARVHSDVTGGTTRDVAHYDWRTRGGDRLVLTDAPGLDEAAGGLDETASAEARRAHLVIFVCDADLTGAQFRALEALLAFGKPLIVALNKSDRYDEAQLDAILARIESRLEGRADAVAVVAGGEETVVERDAGGSGRTRTRPRPPRVEALADALQRRLDADPDALARLRDGAVFRLAEERLDAAERAYREKESERIVRRYSRRAVVGALAAVTPGSDIVIQGALGTAMLRELAKVHEARVRDLDLDRFLELAGGTVRRTAAILMAVAGNALKSFPGLGTVSGGLLHAVAYGMIFESLGNAAARTLATRGELRPLPAVQAFEDTLSEHLQTRAQRFAGLALTERGRDD